MDAKATKLSSGFDDPKHSPSKIFLFEDEPILLKLMEEELVHRNLDVWSFSCPDEFEATCQISDLKGQVLITDEHMPGTNGADFINKIGKELGEERPLTIIFTGDEESLINNKGLDYTDLVVEKPIDPEELIGTLEELVRNR